jgi:glycerate 2-kinase
VDAVDPEPLVVRACSRCSLDTYDPGRVTIVAAGKAAPGMLRGVFAVAPRLRGLVAAQAPPPANLPEEIEWIVTSHPHPDRGSERAARRALALAASSPSDGLLVVLLSGGASSMLAAPAHEVTLDEKAATARALMNAGASIAEVNCVRKHLSAIKGGWLGAAAACRILTLALSDVHGPIADDPSVIGSGPAVADPTTFAEALEVLVTHGVRVPGRVRGRLDAGAAGRVPETPKPGARSLKHAAFEIVGNRLTALAGMRAAAVEAGYEVVTIDRATVGEARFAGRRFVEDAVRLAAHPGRPVCALAAGETVVTVTGEGLGGRNQEFVLGALRALDRLTAEGLVAAMASAGTDGIDGPTGAAGGIADTTSARRARAAGVDIASALRRNDAWPALAALGDLVTWGPTGTNVGDVHVLLCAPVAGRT